MNGAEIGEPARPVAPYSGAIGYAFVLLACASWATSAIFVKLLGTGSGFSALALAFWRDLITFSVLLLGIAVLRPAQLRVSRHDLVWLAAMGCCLGVFHIFWNLGVFLNGAAVAAVQQAAMPAIVAVAAWLLWRESLTWVKVLAIALTFVGTVLVSRPDVAGQTAMTPGAVLIGLGIPILYASWNLLGKQVRARLGSFTILTYAFGFAALVLLPLQLFTPQPWPLPPSGWLWLGGLIGLSTITGFTLYTYALGSMQAGVAAILAMTEIVFVALYAYVLLGERLSASQLAGAALVLLGVLVLSVRGLRRARQ